jgi:hypothetical protein
MKIALCAVAALSLATQAQAMKVRVCNVPFALCAASSASLTGGSVKVVTASGNTLTYPEAMAVCPILHGPSIANLDLMNGSCENKPGMVWSLFQPRKEFPQSPDWKRTDPAVFREFTTTTGPAGGMSNMWSYNCVKQPKKVGQPALAKCYGPINESPWNGDHVPVGTESFSAAPPGALNPVGGNFPIK